MTVTEADLLVGGVTERRPKSTEERVARLKANQAVYDVKHGVGVVGEDRWSKK